MPDKHAPIKGRSNRLKHLNEAVESHQIQLVLISSDEFEAHWTLDEQALDAGLRAASAKPAESRLVLRVFSLPKDETQSDFSSFWQDYTIKSDQRSARISYTAPSERINAAIGLINKSGRFVPLARAQAVTRPLSPAPSPISRSQPYPPASGGKLPSQKVQRHDNR